VRLETKRLAVRPFTEEDLPYAVYLSDPATMKYVEPPMSAGEAVAFLRKYALCAEPLVWALEYRETGLLLGHVIFHPTDRPEEYELGWVLDSRVWNMGVAAESGRALIVHAFAMAGASRTLARTVAENAACRAVIRKLGLRALRRRKGTCCDSSSGGRISAAAGERNNSYRIGAAAAMKRRRGYDK